MCQEYYFRFTPAGDAAMNDILTRLAAPTQKGENSLPR
jgi:hypothetical protein